LAAKMAKERKYSASVRGTKRHARADARVYEWSNGSDPGVVRLHEVTRGLAAIREDLNPTSRLLKVEENAPHSVRCRRLLEVASLERSQTRGAVVADLTQKHLFALAILTSVGGSPTSRASGGRGLAIANGTFETGRTIGANFTARCIPQLCRAQRGPARAAPGPIPHAAKIRNTKIDFAGRSRFDRQDSFRRLPYCREAHVQG
jgi:hypothetical protein